MKHTTLIKLITLFTIICISPFTFAGNTPLAKAQDHIFALHNNTGNDINYHLQGDQCPVGAVYAIPTGKTDTYTEMSCVSQAVYVGTCTGETSSNGPWGWVCNNPPGSQTLCMTQRDLTKINNINITKVNGKYTCSVS